MVSVEQESDGLPFLSGDMWMPEEPDEIWYENLKKKYPKPSDRVLYVADIATNIEALHRHYRLSMGMLFHKMFKKIGHSTFWIEDSIIHVYRNKYNINVKLYPPHKRSSAKDLLWRVTIMYGGSGIHDYITWVRAKSKVLAATLAKERFDRRKSRDVALKIICKKYKTQGVLK